MYIIRNVTRETVRFIIRNVTRETIRFIIRNVTRESGRGGGGITQHSNFTPFVPGP